MKNNRRGGARSDDDELQRLADVAQLYYKESYTEKEIARLLGCSEMQVSRILKRAKEKQIIEITINRETSDDLRRELILKFGLIEARITPHVPNYEETRSLLAMEAARYFDELILTDHSTVGVSGGRTIHRMVDLIPLKPRKIKIYPLTGIWRDLQINYVDSGVLVHSLWLKCLDAAEAFWFPIEPITKKTPKAHVIAQRRKYLRNPQIRAVYRAANDVDLAVIGVGPVRRNSSTIRQLHDIGISYDYLKNRGAVGIAAGVWYNEFAEPVVDDYFLSVQLSTFRDMVKQKNKKVVVVSGGDEKVTAIRVLLQHRICNVLLTDTRTAHKLVHQ